MTMFLEPIEACSGVILVICNGIRPVKNDDCLRVKTIAVIARKAVIVRTLCDRDIAAPVFYIRDPARREPTSCGRVAQVVIRLKFRDFLPSIRGEANQCTGCPEVNSSSYNDFSTDIETCISPVTPSYHMRLSKHPSHLHISEEDSLAPDLEKIAPRTCIRPQHEGPPATAVHASVSFLRHQITNTSGRVTCGYASHLAGSAGNCAHSTTAFGSPELGGRCLPRICGLLVIVLPLGIQATH
jgi:hypothetical protein